MAEFTIRFATLRGFDGMLTATLLKNGKVARTKIDGVCQSSGFNEGLAMCSLLAVIGNCLRGPDRRAAIEACLAKLEEVENGC